MTIPIECNYQRLRFDPSPVFESLLYTLQPLILTATRHTQWRAPLACGLDQHLLLPHPTCSSILYHTIFTSPSHRPNPPNPLHIMHVKLFLYHYSVSYDSLASCVAAMSDPEVLLLVISLDRWGGAVEDRHTHTQGHEGFQADRLHFECAAEQTQTSAL